MSAARSKLTKAEREALDKAVAVYAAHIREINTLPDGNHQLFFDDGINPMTDNYLRSKLQIIKAFGFTEKQSLALIRKAFIRRLLEVEP